ncbi:anthranilate synthase component I family protein [Patescibacteria group bacterium]|nr:anthranilate synthase component I family protein [Patescibacteria group bacterium]
MEIITRSIKYNTAVSYFSQYPEDLPGFLLESIDISPIYGRLSLFAVDPPLEVVGKDNNFRITALNSIGTEILKMFDKSDFDYASKVSFSKQEISGQVKRENLQLSESERLKQPNISFVIRTLISKFTPLLQSQASDSSLLGLYGGFSYDFVRLFEDLPDRHDHGQTPDFHLFLPDVIYFFDHLKEQAALYYFQFTSLSLTKRLKQIPNGKTSPDDFQVTGPLRSNFNRQQFVAGVEKAKEYMEKGDIFEMVLSQKFQAKFTGSTLALYDLYRRANPAPYMFYFNFGKSCLLGASPEMFIRVENGEVNTRPISGTAQRSDDPITDYQNMMSLLNSSKEKSELDMLIDLGRNDISRVCLPGVELSDYRFVEKYSKVMHTVAHVRGRLDKKNFTAFDAFIASLNAGTLTGTPKPRAMELIEEMEPVRRGFYGGNVGYVTFNNELNTGIIIRSAVIADDQIELQAGATLLYDSDPESEYRETEAKAAALVGLLKKK